jgi:hypothetical protein
VIRYLVAAVLTASVLRTAPVLAQSTPAALPAPAASASPAPSPTPSPPPPTWALSGFADGSYSQVFTSKSMQFADGTNSRVFDTSHDTPMFNSLNMQLVKNGTLGGKLELTLGQDANVLASWPTANFVGVDVTNAYLSYATGKFTLLAGKFSTLAGAEVIESPSNLNFSRSILFGYAVPFTHTGVRLTYAATSAFSIIGGVNNGWDNTKGNGTGSRTIEAGLAYTNKNLTLSTQGYDGTEQTAYGYHDSIIDNNGIPNNWSGVTGKRYLSDTVATYKFGPVLSGTLNYDTGSQGNALMDPAGNPTVGAAWNGLAGYVSANVNKITLTGRYEFFNDLSGYRTSYSQRWNEGTITLAYAPSAALLFRLEGRQDTSSVSPWINNNGVPQGHLASLAFESIVKF